MPYFTQPLHCNHSAYPVLAVKSVCQRWHVGRYSESVQSRKVWALSFTDSPLWVLPACHREASRALRLSRFQGRCLWLAERLEPWRKSETRQRGRHPMPPEWFDSTRQPQAPFCRQGAATPANGPASAAPIKDRWSRRSPVLTPHAPSRKPKAIYRGPERGTNPPELFSGARGSSSSTLGRPTVVFRSASRPQVGGLTSDSSRSGHGPLVKAPRTARLVGRFNGVGVARPRESRAGD